MTGQLRQWVRKGVAIAGDNYGTINQTFIESSDSATRNGHDAKESERLDEWREQVCTRMHWNWVEGDRAPLKATRNDSTLYQLHLEGDRGLLHHSRFKASVIDTGALIDLPQREGAAELYKTLEGSMLLVGEPGSGKSVLLWQILEALLDDDSSTEGLPVLVELHRWAAVDDGSGEPPSFERFMCAELTAPAIGLSDRAASQLAGSLVLLLDGLDELADCEAIRCLDSLARYVRDSNGVPTRSVVLTCRVEDYQRIVEARGDGTGAVSNAVRLIGLPPEQVRQALVDDEPPVGKLLSVMDERPILDEMMTNPLWLSVSRRVYQTEPNGDPFDGVGPEADENALIMALYRRWVPLRFARVDPSVADGAGFLAWNMVRNHQQTLYLESILPRWLPNPRPANAIVRVLFAVAGALAATLPLLALEVATPVNHNYWRLTFRMLLFGLPLGVVLIGLAGLTKGRSIPASQRFSLRTPPNRALMLASLLAGVAYGIVLFVMVMVWDVTLRGDTISGSIQKERGSVLFIALLFAAFVAVILWLGACWKQQPAQPGQAAKPTAALTAAARLGLLQGLTAAVIIGATCGLVLQRLSGLGPDLVVTYTAMAFFIGALAGGFLGGLAFGLDHWATRIVLARRGWLPLGLVQVLEALCDAEVGVLYRAGPGYRFRHRTLAEHLATEWYARQEAAGNAPSVR